jgi:hypothetical protein
MFLPLSILIYNLNLCTYSYGNPDTMIRKYLHLWLCRKFWGGYIQTWIFIGSYWNNECGFISFRSLSRNYFFCECVLWGELTDGIYDILIMQMWLYQSGTKIKLWATTQCWPLGSINPFHLLSFSLLPHSHLWDANLSLCCTHKAVDIPSFITLMYC